MSDTNISDSTATIESGTKFSLVRHRHRVKQLNIFFLSKTFFPNCLAEKNSGCGGKRIIFVNSLLPRHCNDSKRMGHVVQGIIHFKKTTERSTTKLQNFKNLFFFPLKQKIWKMYCAQFDIVWSCWFTRCVTK